MLLVYIASCVNIHTHVQTLNKIKAYSCCSYDHTKLRYLCTTTQVHTLSWGKQIFPRTHVRWNLVKNFVFLLLTIIYLVVGSIAVPWYQPGYVKLSTDINSWIQDFWLTMLFSQMLSYNCSNLINIAYFFLQNSWNLHQY